MGKPKIKLFFLPVVSLLTISACTVPPNGNTMTPTPQITNTAPIPPTGTFQFSTATPLVISATPTEVLTETLIPTIPYTPTSSVPLVTMSVGTNCRAGPGIIYDLLDGLMVGEQAEIVKLAPAGVDYVVIQRPHGPGECWLWLQYATITGDLSQLPIAPIPPTPTATITPTATSTDTSTPTETAMQTSPFAGEWTMLLATKLYDVVTVTQLGNTVRGSFRSGPTGNVVTFNGTLSFDGRTVTGTITQSSAPTQPPGPFVWYILENLDQFNGYGDFGRGPVAWCGYRAEQAAPEPCLRGP